jgi:hypothetical protein
LRLRVKLFELIDMAAEVVDDNRALREQLPEIQARLEDMGQRLARLEADEERTRGET